jgi:acetylornithine deacetylase/succinyl-diaminopimelate desuccinylase-like protein
MRTLAADLAELVALPTVASDGAALHAAASWLVRALTELGARARVATAAGRPVVLGERPGPPGAPTVLCYGHLDVVAPGPGWSSPPFRGTRRGGLMFGRGTADDKGPLLAQLHATAAPGPVAWKFVLDGGEEIGSPGLGGLLARLRPWLADVDAVLVCDTEAAPDGRPTLTHSLRGQLTVELGARGIGRALHAGRYGGAVPNPAQALAGLVASLHRRDGSIAVAGFAAARPIDRVPTRNVPAGNVPAGVATVAQRPAIVVNALCAGDCGPGPWHVIPATARAKINVRLVLDQRPDAVFAQLTAHLRARQPPGITLRLRRLVAVHPWAAAPDGPALRAMAGAVRDVWGAPPALVRSGGTIPAVALLARAAPRAELVLLGVTETGDNAHAPDEHVDLARLAATAATVTRFTHRLAGATR